MILAALLLAVIPHSDVVRDECDVLELNHFYTGEGKLVFSQWIFLAWNELKSRHDVIEWAMAKGYGEIAIDADKLRAMVVPAKGGWRLRFSHACVQREITATSFREIHTQYDREVDEREILPKERRRGLSKPLRVPVLTSGERSILR